MNSDIQIRVGRRIRELRTAKGLSQEDLADLANIHWSYIGQIERGRRNLSIASLEKIAHALNISLSELLDHI